MVQELHVYDLDGTLYYSRTAPPNQGAEWYALPQSLNDVGPPGFDRKWNLRVLQAVRKSLNTDNVKVALLSARPHNTWIHSHITRWMVSSGLEFDLIQLRPLEIPESEPYKAMAVAQWLEEYPTVRRVVFWDDQPGNREAVSTIVSYSGRQIILGVP